MPPPTRSTASRPTSRAGLPSTVAWLTSGYWVEEWLPQMMALRTLPTCVPVRSDSCGGRWGWYGGGGGGGGKGLGGEPGSKGSHERGWGRQHAPSVASQAPTPCLAAVQHAPAPPRRCPPPFQPSPARSHLAQGAIVVEAGHGGDVLGGDGGRILLQDQGVGVSGVGHHQDLRGSGLCRWG